MPELRLRGDPKSGYVLSFHSEEGEGGRIYIFGARYLEPAYPSNAPRTKINGDDPEALIERYFKEYASAHIRRIVREGCELGEFSQNLLPESETYVKKFNEEYEKFIRTTDQAQWNKEIAEAKTEASRLYNNWLPAIPLFVAAILIVGLILTALGTGPIGVPIVMGLGAVAFGAFALDAYGSKYRDKRARVAAVDAREKRAETIREATTPGNMPAPAQTADLSPPTSDLVRTRSASLPISNETPAPTDKPRKSFP